MAVIYVVIWCYIIVIILYEISVRFFNQFYFSNATQQKH